MRIRATLLACTLVLAACEQDDPAASPDAGGVITPDTGATPDVDVPCGDAGIAAPPIDESACTPLGTDYLSTNTAGDTWAACISDTDVNVYSPFDPSIGSVARAAQFDGMAPLLWANPVAPTAQNFTDARLLYLTDQGLESRLARREDEHYPPATNGAGTVTACRDLTPAELALHTDRCVGPATLVPIINEAFTAGLAGTGDPRVHAARIEAAALWFFYVSVHKESITCTNVQKDCDSAYAYYTGDATRTGPAKGLAAYVAALSPNTHNRVWDGILAVRCWRDLDNPGGTALNLVMRDLAVAQVDRAALRGVALIVRARVIALLQASCSPADAAVHWAFISTLGRALLREATARDATAAATLTTELAKTDPTLVDGNAIIAALDSTFGCP